MTRNDIFSPYEQNLNCLLKRLGVNHPRYGNALVYRQRLSDNLNRTRRYGDTATHKADRAEIIDYLNQLSLSVFGKPFAQMCAESDTKTPHPSTQTPNRSDDQPVPDQVNHNQVPGQSTETLPQESPWSWTVRAGTFLITGASIIWLIFEPGFEPLIAAIAGILAVAVYFGLRNSHYQQYLDRILAALLVILVPAMIVLIILSGR